VKCLSQVKLRDYVVSALTFSKAKETELAWIEGVLDMSQGKTDTSAMCEPEDGEKSEDGKEKKKSTGNYDNL